MAEKIIPGALTAADFIEQLQRFQSDDEQRKILRYFKTDEGDYGHGDQLCGRVRNGTKRVDGYR